MSAAAMAAGRSASPAAVALTSAAGRSARLRVRLATTMLAAPLRAAVAAASALIEPAPTTSTSRPASGLPLARYRDWPRPARRPR